jgi:hypothetical protein
MGFLDHRDMTPVERSHVERAAHLERVSAPSWSSHTVAVLILLSGSFVAGLVLFGLPFSFLVLSDATRQVRDLVLFVPGLVTMLLGGSWSVVYYLRGSWRVRRELLDDLEYGRVEIVTGVAREAWVIDGAQGGTWLLDLGEEVLLLASSAVPEATPRTFPGRRLRVVRCKHSGLVLELSHGGPALAPSGRLRQGTVVPPTELESARYLGPLDEVCRAALQAA